ncbi:RNaseH domain-containing protein [Streptomyces sp. NPDC088261]|uniref:RNaseH domain-containing protein n=1 Tax=Streptomyces sp. NPDC088261 TaxID=3365851 RepID=UPI003810F0DA
MLITLAYRIPRTDLETLLGTVTAYPLTKEFAAAWDDLPHTKRHRRQPYAALATGLVAATGQPVRLFGEGELADDERATGSRMLLLTTDNALDYRLRVAVRAWERHIREGKGASGLADFLPEPDGDRSFAEFITFRSGMVPTAPNWVFRTAAWQIMKQLACAPILLDERRSPLTLRMDTDGSLLAWDRRDLIVNRSGSAFSMARVSARLITRAGVDDAVVCFDAHLSRVSPQGHWAKNVWIDRGDAGTPILRLPLLRSLDKETEHWRSDLNPAIAKILEACQLQPLRIPDELPDVPHLVRPHMAGSRFHALGSGPGPRFMLRLHEHIVRMLPRLVPLTYETDRRIKLLNPVKQYPAGGLPAAGVGSSGYDRVTLACVYSTSEARQRMLDELGELAGRPVSPDPDSSAPVAINDRLDVVARHCPDLLAHETANRAALLDSLRLSAGPGHLVAAWLETEFHPAAERPALDAKPHLRRLLGHLGMPTQFLATDPLELPDDVSPRSAETKKYAARAALRDLLRSSGVLDDRLLVALTGERLANPLDRKALLVGIHMRRQQTGASSAPFVLVMVAMYVDPDALEPWRVLVYSGRRRAWVRAAEGTADFYAGPIGTTRLGRTQEKAERTREEIEDRLLALCATNGADIPVVIFADTRSTRTVWPGLQDSKLGAGPLPGDGLRARGGDVAVVRLSTDVKEIGRPVTRRERANMPKDPLQPAAPDRKVYRLTDSTANSWLLAGRSVTIKSKGGDRGARYTRWTLPPELRSELRVPWHAYTAREILVVQSGTWLPESLVALTARLCDQSVSWDDRTTLPGPLHLATVIDEDHPEYRASAEDMGDED